MSKHTPTPWIINQRTQYIENVNCGIVADVNKLQPEDAEHIVKCVNAHETLMADREGLNNTIKELMEFVETISNYGLRHHSEQADKLIDKYGG